MNKSQPAFPHIDAAGVRFESGMTLRDYFAAEAMHRASAPSKANTAASGYQPDWYAMAIECYAIADAMLAERNK